MGVDSDNFCLQSLNPVIYLIISGRDPMFFEFR